MCISGDYEAAISEHQQELALSEVLNDVIGRAVANRKIGECYAEMGNIKAALKVSRLVCFIKKYFVAIKHILKTQYDTNVGDNMPGLIKTLQGFFILKKVRKGLFIFFFFSTSGVTWTLLALSKIMLRSKGHWPLLVEPTCSVMNPTNQGTV